MGIGALLQQQYWNYLKTHLKTGTPFLDIGKHVKITSVISSKYLLKTCKSRTFAAILTANKTNQL
jgi:hypothetical protein